VAIQIQSSPDSASVEGCSASWPSWAAAILSTCCHPSTAEVKDLQSDFAKKPKEVEHKDVKNADSKTDLTGKDLGHFVAGQAEDEDSTRHDVEGKVKPTLEDHIPCFLTVCEATRPTVVIEFSFIHFSPGITDQKSPVSFKGIWPPSISTQQVCEAKHVAADGKQQITFDQGPEEKHDSLPFEEATIFKYIWMDANT